MPESQRSTKKYRTPNSKNIRNNKETEKAIKISKQQAATCRLTHIDA